jgi:hypothetical protein
MRDTSRAIRASVAGIVLSVAFLTSWLARPPSVAACSCAEPSLARLATSPGAVVFSGLVGVRDPIGLQVAVDRWFVGRGVAPLVHLDPAYLNGDSAGCGIAAPPAGSRWLFGGTREEGSDLISIGLCSPHGDLATPEGRALLAEAATTFPGIVVPQPSDGARLPLVAPGPDPISTLGGVVPFLAIGVSTLVAAGLVVLVVAIARRRRTPG